MLMEASILVNTEMTSLTEKESSNTSIKIFMREISFKERNTGEESTNSPKEACILETGRTTIKLKVLSNCSTEIPSMEFSPIMKEDVVNTPIKTGILTKASGSTM